MVSEIWVINASPLISLGRIDQLTLLEKLAGEILVPEAVITEVRAGFGKDRFALSTVSWAESRRVSDIPIPLSVAGWYLGRGESQVLAYCLEKPAKQAVLDDGIARQCAAALAVPMIGTLGVILRAKRQGLLAEARPWMKKLHENGLFLDQNLIDKALAQAGE
ncbi:MAG: DUF3368 domain-containing protein [Candidatus Competibacteraceae bacterium]